jgi:putative ABC transport system permease protein
MNDLKFAFRQLLKNPGFTAVAVLTLALGIGANTAVFSVINATLLRPFPYENPERLVILQERNAGGGLQDASYLNFTDWRSQSASFESMAAQRGGESFNFSGADEPERLQGQIVSANFFQTLGIRPFRGRDFVADHNRPGALPVAILSYGFWQRRFGAEESVLGKPITLNNQSFTVIGVTPANFQFGTAADVFVPIGLSAERFKLRGRDPGVGVVARLKPAVSIAQAESELNAIAARLEQEYPETNTGKRVRVESLHESFVGGTRLSLLTLLGAVGLVLLIACANVANLLLVRGATRQREMALRAALGAGRWHIVRQLLGESLLLAALGGVLGVLLAHWGTNLITSYLPGGVPRLREADIDSTVFGFTLGLSLLAGVVFGMAPAWQASRANLTQVLQEGGRGSTGSRQRLRSALVVSEIALTLAVLVGAGLLIRSFWRLQQVDSGFDARNVLMMQISVKAGPGEGAIAALFEQLRQKVRSLPGVKSVAVSDALPILRDANWSPFNIEGQPTPEPGNQTWAIRYTVSPEYFQTLGIQSLKGREFTAQDTLNSPPVAIIDETFARQHFQNEDPLGQGLILALPDGPGIEIVGVVRHVKHAGLDERAAGSPQFYLNFNQRRSSASHLLVRSEVDPLSLAGAVRDQVWALNKDQPVYNVRTMQQLVSQSIAPRRFSALLMVIFGFVALVLASIGLYGMMSYSVSQRTSEIGIRVALGAQRRDVLTMVIKQAIGLALLGVVAGLVTALALARLLRNLLFGVGAADPLTFGVVAFVLFGVALAASLVPARRATKVDPMVALRYQ